MLFIQSNKCWTQALKINLNQSHTKLCQFALNQTRILILMAMLMQETQLMRVMMTILLKNRSQVKCPSKSKTHSSLEAKAPNNSNWKDVAHPPQCNPHCNKSKILQSQAAPMQTVMVVTNLLINSIFQMEISLLHLIQRQLRRNCLVILKNCKKNWTKSWWTSHWTNRKIVWNCVKIFSARWTTTETATWASQRSKMDGNTSATSPKSWTATL